MMGFLEAADLFHGAWKIYRQYFGSDMSKEDWDRLIAEIDQIYEKCRKEEFAKDILVAVINEIERMDRRKKSC